MLTKGETVYVVGSNGSRRTTIRQCTVTGKSAVIFQKGSDATPVTLWAVRGYMEQDPEAIVERTEMQCHGTRDTALRFAKAQLQHQIGALVSELAQLV